MLHPLHSTPKSPSTAHTTNKLHPATRTSWSQCWNTPLLTCVNPWSRWQHGICNTLNIPWLVRFSISINIANIRSHYCSWKAEYQQLSKSSYPDTHRMLPQTSTAAACLVLHKKDMQKYVQSVPMQRRNPHRQQQTQRSGPSSTCPTEAHLYPPVDIWNTCSWDIHLLMVVWFF